MMGERMNTPRALRKKDVTAAGGACARRTKNQKLAPKIYPDMMPGQVEVQFKKCGRGSCKCSRGDLHGPYFYLRTWANNQRSKSYVRLGDVRDVRRACDNYRRFQAQLREGRAAFKLLMAKARELFG